MNKIDRRKFIEGFRSVDIPTTIAKILAVLNEDAGDFTASAALTFNFARKGKRLEGYYAFGRKKVLRFEFYTGRAIQGGSQKEPRLVSVSVWNTGDSLGGRPVFIVQIRSSDALDAARQIADAIQTGQSQASVEEAKEFHSKALMEATLDDIKRFVDELGDDGGSFSGMYRKYLKWAEDNGLKAVSDSTFINNLRAIRTRTGVGATTSEPAVKVVPGVPDDSSSPSMEYDEFELEVLNNTVLYKYEMMAEITKRIVTWDPLYKNAFIYGVGGVGKEQPHSAKILLPDGTWTTMGEIKAGEQVKTPSGRLATVLQKFPQGVKPVFKLTLRDGSTTRAGAEHLWKCKRDSGQEVAIKTTAQLYETLNSNKKRFDNGEIKSAEAWYLPMVEPLEYNASDTELPIDPYFLGLLLGDGGMTNGLTFTTADPELKQSLENYLSAAFDVELRQMKDDPITWRLVSAASKKGYTPRGSNKLIAALRQLGLYGKRGEFKFVPEAYKRASAADRFSLIQGLIDTDGWMSPSPCFDSTAKQLAEDYVYLVRSLGGRAHISSHIPTCTHKGKRVEGKRAYNVVSNLPIDLGTPCRLPRKREIYEANNRQNRRWQSITSIELDGQEECSCIMLDDPEHLYITDDFIVTHNTFTVQQIVDRFAKPDSVETYKGAISGFTGLLQVLWNNRQKKVIIFDDNDGLLDNANALNMLKVAMENSDPRIVSYMRFKRGAPSAREKGIVVDVSRLHEKLVSIYANRELLCEESVTSSEATWYAKMAGTAIDKHPMREADVEDYDPEDFTEEDLEYGDLDPSVDPAYGMDEEEGVPDRFQFTSRIIFISNLMKVPQPMLDRCISIGLLLTKEQILDLIESKLEFIMAKEAPQVTLELKKEVLAFMRKYVHRIGKPLTFRLFMQLCAMFYSGHPEAKKMAYMTMMGEGMKTTLR